MSNCRAFIKTSNSENVKYITYFLIQDVSSNTYLIPWNVVFWVNSLQEGTAFEDIPETSRSAACFSAAQVSAETTITLISIYRLCISSEMNL